MSRRLTEAVLTLNYKQKEGNTSAFPKAGHWNTRRETYQKAVNILWSANQHGEIAKLLSQSQKDLIFIIDGICRTVQRHVKTFRVEPCFQQKGYVGQVSYWDKGKSGDFCIFISRLRFYYLWGMEGVQCESFQRQGPVQWSTASWCCLAATVQKQRQMCTLATRSHSGAGHYQVLMGKPYRHQAKLANPHTTLFVNKRQSYDRSLKHLMDAFFIFQITHVCIETPCSQWHLWPVPWP